MTRPRRGIRLAALAAAGICALAPVRYRAAAADDDEDVRISDPEMRSEMERVDESNLENALETADEEGKKALVNVLALVHSSKGGVQGVLEELRSLPKGKDGQSPVEEAEDSVLLSSQMLDKREEEFRLKAASASVTLPGLDPDKLASRRRGYRAGDRARDLGKTESYLKIAEMRYPAELEAAENELLESLEAYHAELSSARGAVGEATERLAALKKSRRQDSAFENVQEHAARLDADLVDLGREIRLLRACLKLSRHDRAAFKAKPKRTR